MGTWPPSCSPRSRPTSSRSRRLRRLPPSTWPSSGRPSRSWRRSRSAPSLPPSSKPYRIGTQLKLEKNLTKSGTRLCNNDPTAVKIQKLPRHRLQIPQYIIKLCFPKTLLDVALGRPFLLQKFSAPVKYPNFCFVTYNKL